MSVEELIPPDGQPRVRASALAKRLGVSKQTIYRWVRKGHIPPPTRLSRGVQWHNVAKVKASLKAYGIEYPNGRKGSRRG